MDSDDLNAPVTSVQITTLGQQWSLALKVFVLLIYKSSLHIVDVNNLSTVTVVNIFFNFMVAFFTLMSFDEQSSQF